MLKKLFDSLGGSSKPKNDDYGFEACGTCTTGHVPTCSSIDNELAARYGLDPKAPDFAETLKGIKAIAFNM